MKTLMETILRIFFYILFSIPSLYPAWVVLKAVEKSNVEIQIGIMLYVTFTTIMWISIVASFTILKRK
jgi:hypothetical protein